MNMLAFDTLAYSKRLQEAGVPSAQAEAHAIAQADFLTHHLLSAVATKTDLAELKVDMATKADLADLKTELKTDLTELKTELKTDLADLKTELKTDLTELKTDMVTKAELKADMAEMETRLTMRMLLMVGILATLMTVFKFMG